MFEFVTPAEVWSRFTLLLSRDVLAHAAACTDSEMGGAHFEQPNSVDSEHR